MKVLAELVGAGRGACRDRGVEQAAGAQNTTKLGDQRAQVAHFEVLEHIKAGDEIETAVGIREFAVLDAVDAVGADSLRSACDGDVADIGAKGLEAEVTLKGFDDEADAAPDVERWAREGAEAVE
jgi:hypothetical protein